MATTGSHGLENIISSMEEIRLNFPAAVSKLFEELIAEASQLQKLQAEIDVQKYKLKYLYNLDIIDDSSLTQLIQEYQHSKEAFEKEYQEKKITLIRKHQLAS